MDSTKAPSAFYCPITCEVMRDPLMCRSGLSFERNAIIEWLHNHSTCPMTRQPMTVGDLVPNRALQERIRTWCNRNDFELNDDYDDYSGSDTTCMPYFPAQDARLPCYISDLPPMTVAESGEELRNRKSVRARISKWFSSLHRTQGIPLQVQ